MRPWPSMAIVALGLGIACQDPETTAAQGKLRTANNRINEGRALLAANRPDEAVEAFKIAASAAPDDAAPDLLLAQAHEQAGNDAAALLALKQASELAKAADPSVKRQLAELYRREGAPKQAAALYQDLREVGQLTDDETVLLARLLAAQGDLASATQVLNALLAKKPGDPDAQVAAAEVRLLAGEEVEAATQMDDILARHPRCAAARLLRAHYFLNAGYAEQAEQDLEQITGADAENPEVVELRARALNQLKRHRDAEAALRALLRVRPRDVGLLSQLADTQLDLGDFAEAERLLDQALAQKPKSARAHYVRGRAYELQGNPKAAVDNYEQALKQDPRLAPALSRIWRIYRHRGDASDAAGAIERLLALNEASTEEKAELAGIYAEDHVSLERGRKLIADALRREPKNPRYLAIKKALGSPPKSKIVRRPVILRRGH